MMIRRAFYIQILLMVALLSGAPLLVSADELISVSAQVDGVAPGGGGGGGGGGSISSPTSVVFSGRAYPLSKVTILKDGVIAVTTIAGPNAEFSASISNLTQGNFTFTVFGEDSSLRHSSLFTFPLYITSGVSTTVSGIFITPTIGIDKSEVKQGDNLIIFGKSAPLSNVVIAVNSAQEIFSNTVTDSVGAYLFNFDTSVLEIGQHSTKSRATLQNEASTYSPLVSFSVGTTSVQAPVLCARKGDLNSDCRVNLIDFSILAFWYKKSNVPARVDLNNDTSVTLIDFSIMAFNWTG